MFLKKIYVNGFKSFADKTEIIVENGITAIVGPNGSGKSNISDAIKWVLGEQSAKSLRGGKMDDIIFAGTEKRLPLGYAEVNLIFDNQSGSIPLEYKEVSIKRKLYKTGESEYFINKQQCRLKDVRELFMDTGIGRDGYSFIGQGRVEDILSPNSDTRREVFEEAAGIVKYKTRKEEAVKKLEKTNDNLDRVEDIIHELRERIDPLSEQSLRAQQYIELKNNLKNYELNYFVHEYEKHNDQLSLLENQRNNSTEEKSRLQRKRDAIQESIAKEKEKIADLQREAEELEKLLDIKNKEYESFKSMSKVFNEKKILYMSNLGSITAEIDSLNNRNKEIQSELDSLNAQKSALIEKLSEQAEKSESMNSEVHGYRREIDNAAVYVEAQKNELFELHKEINKLNNLKSTLVSFIENDSERIELMNKEITAEEKEKNSKYEIIKILEGEIAETLAFISESKRKLNELNDKVLSKEKEKKSLEDEIRKINDDLSNAKSKLNILSNMEAYYDGYFKSVKSLMNSKDKNPMLNRSILGTVADIISTKKEYETAIETALGSAIQNVIVNSENEAEDIIEYLKKNKIGRVTFLPIEMIQERSITQPEMSVMNDPCIINTADMLVETDKRFKKVVKHLLGRIIVVDNLNNGFKISKRLGSSLKIVTLQGDVINAGGSVTGGHIAASQNILGRKREIEELRELNVSLSKTLKDKTSGLENTSSELKLLGLEIESIKNTISEKNSSYSAAESKKNMLREQADKSLEVINKYIKEKTFMEEEKNRHREEHENNDIKIEEFKKSIQEKENEIQNILTENESNKIRFEEYNAVIEKFKEEISQTRQDIKITEEKISNINSEISRNNEAKAVKHESLENIRNEIETADKSAGEYSKNMDELNLGIEKIADEHKSCKEDLSKLQNGIYEYQNRINDTNKLLTDLLDDENSMNVKIEREKARVEDISAKLWEEYEMNYAMAIKYKDDTISQTRLYNEVNAFKKSIKELGNINMDSIEEYKEVKERFEFLSKQKEDLNDAKTQLLGVIKELEFKMKDKFLEEFGNIRIKFNEVFKKLFNGGSGDVYLLNEDDALCSDIEIAVQPPGKKLSKISLLSGGEKALTAIALLFAILKTKPTPFCILDEIEAALDDANISRFSEYLKEFSMETQFIVITHRKGTMEYADTMYGATMEEKGVTKLVSLKLSDMEI